ncbi:MAG TPA: hypothetical protein VFQ44_26885 [Streptosporangiaceae bacterium]|nr:hypothetical protein [Streptosporangiaceae bacterium]
MLAAPGMPSGGPATGAASGSRRQLSTPARLSRLLAAVLAATVLFWIAATTLQQGLQAAAHSARDTLSPAYQDAAQARASLSDADLAVWQAFRSGAARVTGPGLQYQNDITNVEEALQRLAALGSADSSQLQTISGQLVSYQSLVEQADAEYRKDIALGAASKGALGLAYLTYASDSLRDKGGLLANIDKLAGPGQQALDGQLASPWANRALLLVFAAPALLVLSRIAAAQKFLRRRFKRAISLPLWLAGAATCGLAAWMVIATWHAASAFAVARQTALPLLAKQWESQTAKVDTMAKALRAPTATSTSAVLSGGGLNPSVTKADSTALDKSLAAAEDAGGLPVGIPVLAAAAIVLCCVGFRPRLNEYRAIPAGTGVRLRVGRAAVMSPNGQVQR